MRCGNLISRPNHGRPRARSVVPTTAALLVLASACVGLTACGGSSNAAQQARSPSPQEIETYKKHRAELLELVSCAHRHGVPLPTPTPDNRINTEGVNLKSHRRKAALNACYQKVVNRTELEEQAEQTEHQGGPRRLGEEPAAGQAQTGRSQGTAFKQEHERLVEVVACARRHGIHLPEPDAHNNINTRGALGTRHEKNAMKACVRAAVNASAERQAQAQEQQSGPSRLGEESPTG